MMIDTQQYVDNVKGYPYEKLIKERNRLVKSLKDFEKGWFAGDKSGDEWYYCPSPDVVYQCELEYLSALCDFMNERFNNDYIRETTGGV